MVMTINQRRQRGESVPVRYEFKGMTKDGRVIYIEVSAATIVYRGTPENLVYLRDVTERKVAEETMRNERNRFRTLSESAPFGIIMINKEGVFEYINPKFKELFGYDLEEIPNSMQWFRKAFPDPKARREVISTSLAGKEKHVFYKWSVLPGFEETFSRLLVTSGFSFLSTR
jgi:PAS domain-containing protein